MFVILGINANKYLHSTNEITCYNIGNTYSFVISQLSTCSSATVSDESLLGFEISQVHVALSGCQEELDFSAFCSCGYLVTMNQIL